MSKNRAHLVTNNGLVHEIEQEGIDQSGIVLVRNPNNGDIESAYRFSHSFLSCSGDRIAVFEEVRITIVPSVS